MSLPRTAAIAVVYRADAEPLALWSQVRSQVAQLILVDNSVHGRPDLAKQAAESGLTILHNHNRGGLAGAYNRALERLAQTHPQLDQVVLLDDDSDTAVLHKLLTDPLVMARLARPDTAAIAPAYVDRATGLRGRYIELGRFKLHFLPRVFTGPREVAFIINSMSVWRVDALRRIGAFHEGLAIDHVDTEYCLRARGAGLKLVVFGDHEFAHSIGQRRSFTLFGKQMQAGGHSAQRRYLIGRNTAWLARRYLWREPAFAWLCLSRLAYECVGIVMAESSRAAKLWAVLSGSFVGLFSRRLTW